MIMPIEPIDHLELAVERAVTQFKESVNFIGYLKALLVEANNLEEVFTSLLTERWIDTAVGRQLDILGKIVGQPRVIVNATQLFYFGFSPNAGAQSFGDINDPSVGGRFRSIGESTTGNRVLTDAEYREYIKIRIVKNSITPTMLAMQEFFQTLLNTPNINIIDNPMFYIVQIGKVLDPNEKAFLQNATVIPKVAAVGVEYQEYNPDLPVFGFNGVAGSAGFGDLNDPLIGGYFASLI